MKRYQRQVQYELGDDGVPKEIRFTAADGRQITYAAGGATKSRAELLAESRELLAKVWLKVEPPKLEPRPIPKPAEPANPWGQPETGWMARSLPPPAPGLKLLMTPHGLRGRVA